ncbi:RDD family protein [Curtobacterium sp. RRHDQ10]|uniref:RDD family protein n=1 Tax=Curtobacterium phyllosphaerae TaxID=3413379 RepID=UPI003BF3B721
MSTPSPHHDRTGRANRQRDHAERQHDLTARGLLRTLDDEAPALVVGEAVALDVQPASIALRLAGGIIDGIVYVLLWIALVIGGVVALSHVEDDAWLSIWSVVALVLAIVVAPTALEVASHGKSIGRWAVGTRVVRMDGGSVGSRQAFARALIGVLELFSTVGALALLVALFGARPRRLGDLMAGTFVQLERIPRSQDPVVSLPPDLVGWASVADVSRLPQRLEDRLAGYFRTATTLRPDLRWSTASALAAQIAPYARPVPPVDPERYLAGVVALRRERDVRALASRARTLQGLAEVASARPTGFPHR